MGVMANSVSVVHKGYGERASEGASVCNNLTGRLQVMKLST